MGYGDYLKKLLKPLGIYDLRSGTYNSAELEALGAALDACAATAEDTERECVVQTAEDTGLAKYEELFLKSPVSDDLPSRRNAVLSLLTVDDAGFTPGAIGKTVSGCGITAEIRESDEPYTVCVRFPGVRGLPLDYERIIERLGQIIPCHLDIVFAYEYPAWLEIEAGFPSWMDVESRGLTWIDLERFVLPEEE